MVVITDDVLTAKMAGPAIRAWHIAEALAAEHEVVLATTSSLCALSSPHFSVEAADRARFAELERWCDVAVVQGYLLHNVPELRTSDKVMVFDLYDPLPFEALVLTRGDSEPDRSFNVANTVGTLEEQLARGDFFVCASDKQRDLWLGFLAALGRINPRTYGDDPTLRRLIDVVPFGLPDDPPVHERAALRGVVPGIGADDDVVIWGGGLYDWFDPLTLVRAIDKARVRADPGCASTSWGRAIPSPTSWSPAWPSKPARLADDLGLTGSHVFFNEGWVAYDDRQNYLMESDVGVSLHFEHIETAYSFRTRMLDYLWTGLPIVATAGDGFADIIAAEGIGTVVPGAAVDAFADALVAVLGDRGAAARCRAGAAAVATRFRWSAALEPLVSFCAAPHGAPDAPGWPARSQPAPALEPCRGRRAGLVGRPAGGEPVPPGRCRRRRERALGRRVRLLQARG